MKKLEITSAEILDARDATPQRRRSNRESRVPEIIDVSINVLINSGYAGYSINRVADDAGVRLSTLQHYFPTREALLRATLEEIAKRYFDRYREIAENKARAPGARLAAILDEVFEEFVKPGLPAAIFEAWGLALHEPFARDVISEIQKGFTRLFATLVGEINPTLSLKESQLRGALIMSNFQGLIVFLRWSDDDAAHMQGFRKAVGVVWTGLSMAAE
jgi:AcrR family transcriptional regulator